MYTINLKDYVEYKYAIRQDEAGVFKKSLEKIRHLVAMWDVKSATLIGDMHNWYTITLYVNLDDTFVFEEFATNHFGDNHGK